MTRTEQPARWWWLVGAATALGLAVRLASVLARPHLAAAGDAAGYLGQANLLVAGKGWIDPFAYYAHGVQQQTANLPPLYTLLLATCSLFFKSFFAHRLWSAVLSSLGVVLSGLAGREVAGPAVGAVAAFGYAVYPNVWMSAGLGMSEAVSPVLVLLVVWLAYRFWRTPSMRGAALLGLAIGFAALARDELILFSLLILVPLALIARAPGLTRMMGVGVLAVAIVVAPWVVFNTVRFHQTVLVSDRFGATLSVANCDQTYSGHLAGFWWIGCQEVPIKPESQPSVDAADRRLALRYVDSHLSRLPEVEFDRLGRTFGFFRPAQQMYFDSTIESRPHVWAVVGLFAFYGLAAGSIWGGGVLRRRGVTLLPMVAVAVEVILVSVVTYGNTRFRAPLEPVLLILAATAAVDLVGRRRRPAPSTSPARCDPSSAPASVGGRPVGGAS